MAPAAWIYVSLDHYYRHVGSTTYTTRGQVTSHPLGVAILVLLVAEHSLELVTEGEVQGLCREVSDNVGSVTTPQGHDTLVGRCPLEAVANAGVFTVETTGLQHLILLNELVRAPLLAHPYTTYLVLDQKLDTLNGSGSGLRDGGGDTTHQEVRHEGLS